MHGPWRGSQPASALGSPQAVRGLDIRQEGLRPVRQDVGLCSVVRGRVLWWHLVASLVGGLPEAHWKHHFLMQTNDGAAQRSLTAGRRNEKELGD